MFTQGVNTLALSLLCAASSQAAALYWVGADIGDDIPSKWTTGIDVTYNDPAADISRVWGSASSVVARLSGNPLREWVAAYMSSEERTLPPGVLESWLAETSEEANRDRRWSIVEGEMERSRRRGEQNYSSSDLSVVWQTSDVGDIQVIPEPASAILIAAGGLIFGVRRRR